MALWSGDNDDAREEHLFACDACAAASEQMGRLVVGLRELIPPVISHAHRDRLAARGLRLRHTPVQAGVDAEARFSADVDLLIHVLRADLQGAARVDLAVLDERTGFRVELPDVPFDGPAGEVLIACQRHYQHDPLLSGDPIFELEIAGRKARYFVRHHWG